MKFARIWLTVYICKDVWAWWDYSMAGSCT